MKLEKYISNLLYQHDLVIIPGFGGIIARKKNAGYNRENYIFSPPHKELSFNELLQNNDALLANYIARELGITYEEAMDKIVNEVEEWQKILQKDKRLKLDQIGVFNLTSENKLFFLPLTTKNYYAGAYGLTSFIHKPKLIQQELKQAVETTSSVRIDQKRTPKTNKPIVQKQKNTYQLWKYAAVFVIGLGIMGVGASWLNQKSKASEASFQKASFVLPDDFPVIVIDSNREKQIEEKTVKEKKSEPSYFIISGAFRSYKNAEKKKKMLMAQGFQAGIIGKNQRGLYLVAYDGFESRQQATEKLKKIKEIQPGAWIFYKK